MFMNMLCYKIDILFLLVLIKRSERLQPSMRLLVSLQSVVIQQEVHHCSP